MPITAVTVRYIGRAVAVGPGVFGELLEKYCTVNRSYTDQQWIENELTGETHPKVVQMTEKVELFWYVDHKGTETFCAYAGFGPGIIEILENKGISVTVEEGVDSGLEEPDLSKLRGVMWRNRQDEVVSLLMANNRGIIVCPTAFGKSFIIRQLAKAYPNATIGVTVPSKDIAKTIYDELSVDIRPLGFLGGGRNQIGRVTVCVTQSLHKLPKDVNLLLVDECHSVLTDHYIERLNQFHRAKLFGFTASPVGRSDKADRLGLAVFGPVLIEVGYAEAVAGKNVSPINVRMYRSDVGPDVSGSHLTLAQINKAAFWRNGARNALIAKATRQAMSEIGPDDQVLVMVDTLDHAYLLGQQLPEFTIVAGKAEPARIARLEKLKVKLPEQAICTEEQRETYRKQFESRELRLVISTKVWKQGVDFRDLGVLVRADGSASGIDATQIPGRLSRLGRVTDKQGGLLIDFLDSFSSNLVGRPKKRMKIYTDHGWSVQILAPPP